MGKKKVAIDELPKNPPPIRRSASNVLRPMRPVSIVAKRDVIE